MAIPLVALYNAHKLERVQLRHLNVSDILYVFDPGMSSPLHSTVYSHHVWVLCLVLPRSSSSEVIDLDLMAMDSAVEGALLGGAGAEKTHQGEAGDL